MVAILPQNNKGIDYDANARMYIRDLEQGKKPDIRPEFGRWEELIKDLEQSFEPDPDVMQKTIKASRREWPELDTLLSTEEEFQFLEVRDLATLPKPEWLIYDMYSSKGVQFLYGKRGCGKTYVAISQACSVAMQVPENQALAMAYENALNWCGRATKHGHVLYIAGEDIDEVAQRVHAWMKHYGVQDIPNLHFLPCPLQLNTRTPAFIEAVKRRYQDIDIKMIVVDTLAVCSMGLEENSKKEFDGVLQALEDLWRTFECSVIAVHHAGKNGEMRGTSSMDGIAYSMIEVSQEDENIKLRSEKKRRGKSFDAFYLNMETIELPGLDEMGKQNTSCVVTASDRQMESDAERLSKYQQSVLDVIQALGGRSVARADVLKEMGIVARSSDERRFANATKYLVQKQLISSEQTGRNTYFTLQGMHGQETEKNRTDV